MKFIFLYVEVMFTPTEINEAIESLGNDKDTVLWFLEATQESLFELLENSDEELEENNLSREKLEETNKVITYHAKKVLKSN